MKINKIILTLGMVSIITVQANAFAFLIPAGIAVAEFFVAEATSVVVIGEAIAAGEGAAAVGTTVSSATSYGMKKTITKVISGPSNYKNEWTKNNSSLSQEKYIKDPYSGRVCEKSGSHIDHIWPKSKGGPNYSWNLIPSCAKENIQKSNKIGIETLQGYTSKIKQTITGNY